MISDTPPAIAARLMSEFAKRTGLSPAAENPRRYLWTDAFAVCNFLELFQRTEDHQYRGCATELIDQVHRVLGRYRDDDLRRGWISGLDDERGRYQPTVGGLRIGKPLREHGANEVIDDRLEWDRDGQYFHYLTKWVHALCQADFVTSNHQYVRWASELAETAFRAFVPRSGSAICCAIRSRPSLANYCSRGCSRECSHRYLCQLASYWALRQTCPYGPDRSAQRVKTASP